MNQVQDISPNSDEFTQAASVVPLASIIERTKLWALKQQDTKWPTCACQKVRLTLFGRCMPISWLWENERLLPVLVSVGANDYRSLKTLIVDPGTISGFSLPAEYPFSEAMLESAFSRVTTKEHSVRFPGQPSPKDGFHIEFEGLWRKGAFWDIIHLYGPAELHIFSKILHALKEPFWGVCKEF